MRQEPTPIFVTQRQAARLVGISYSTMKKCFMAAEKRPANLPGPPRHRRRGRSVYIFTATLAEWAAGFGLQPAAVMATSATKSTALKQPRRRTRLEMSRERDVSEMTKAIAAA